MLWVNSRARASNQPTPLPRGWKGEMQMSPTVTEKVLPIHWTKKTASRSEMAKDRV